MHRADVGNSSAKIYIFQEQLRTERIYRAESVSLPPRTMSTIFAIKLRWYAAQRHRLRLNEVVLNKQNESEKITSAVLNL